jgi:uncharacterized protein YeaO (DUF488 family)
MVSIMSRNTRDDGYSTDRDINLLDLAEWWPWFAPEDKLIGSYLRGETHWEDFESAYLQYLRGSRVNEMLDLIGLALRQHVVVMCKELKPDFCHRRLLAEECRRLNPDLWTKIN